MSRVTSLTWSLPLSQLALVLLLLAGAPSVSAAVEESGSLRGFLAGSAPGCAYDNWLSHVSENVARPGFNAYAPPRLDPQLNGFGSFQLMEDGAAGDSLLQVFRELTVFLLEGDTAAARLTLDLHPEAGYQLAVLHDSTAARDFLVLREPLDSTWTDPGLSSGPQDDVVGSFARGWGVFVFNPQAARPELAVQAPHPCDDYASPCVALEFFLEADAGLLMINGACREVAYTGPASSYTNTVSLSDPTRNCRTPYAAVHEAFLAHERGLGRDELVVQLHSYDDFRHPTLTSWVATTGPSNRIPYPVLFDTGGAAKGLLDNLRQPVFAADSLGWSHDAWRLQDYVSTNSQYTMAVDGGLADSLIWVPQSSGLPGYGANCQIVASYGQNYPECDRLERILHLELDELPTPAHALGAEAFYEVDPDTSVATWANFARAWAFARPFFDALLTARDSLAAFQDLEAPTRPEALSAAQQGGTGARLVWLPSLSVRFNTYEVLVDTALVIGPSPRLVTRSNAAGLCWPGCRGVDVTGLTPGLSYTFAVRARDAQDRVSPLSESVRLHILDILPPVVDPLERRLAEAGQPLALRAQVTDHSPLTVVLRSSLSGGGWSDVGMADLGGGLFEALLEPLQAADTLRWLVVAQDMPQFLSLAQSDTVTTVAGEIAWQQACESAAGLAHEAFGGGTDQWRQDGWQPFEGAGGWRFGGANGANYANGGAGWLTLDPLPLPAPLRDRVLGFWSRVDAEVWAAHPDSCYDGGLVQWQAAPGVWSDAPLQPLPDHWLRSTAAVPLDWPQRMVSGSSGWQQVLLPLPDDLDTLRLRFGFVSDGAVTRQGWSLDLLELGGRWLAVPDAPVLLATGDSSGVRLSWTPVPGALAYRVESAPSAWGPWSAETQTTYSTVFLPAPAPDGLRLYRVRALGED